MNDAKRNSHENENIGVVVIGRNEGQRLRKAIESVIVADIDVSVVYVDSGSSDGSVELAKSFDVVVHALDPEKPFSPSRARVEGVEQLLSRFPDISFIQFLDGDCELDPDWMKNAVNYLKSNDDTAVVCGMLDEAFPESSIYNKLSPQRWKQSTGNINACGGIFVVKRACYNKVGGFKAELLTREESDLCARIRSLNYSVVRLDYPMAKHDSGLITFRQWWSRAVWGGYGDALSVKADPKNPESKKRLKWYIFWPFLTPVLIITGIIGMFFTKIWGLLLVFGIIAQGQMFARNLLGCLRQGDSISDGILYAFFTALRNFACGFGFMKSFKQRNDDLKRPDPHSL